MEAVEVDQDPSVEVRNEIGFGVKEVVVGNGENLKVGEYTDNFGARNPGVFEF